MKMHIEFNVEGDVGRIVLVPEPADKPPALDREVLGQLEAVIERIADHAGRLRAAVISSASPKHFLVGANINALAQLNAETMGDWVRAGHALFNRLENLPLPVIARVEGNALGGGLELALACDFIVAGQGARFGQPEASLGLVTGWGGAWRLRRRIGLARARELLYTGRIIDVVRAFEIGLCDYHGTTEAIDAWIKEFLNGVRAMSSDAIAETKAMLGEFDKEELTVAGKLEAIASQRLIASPDTTTRLNAFFEKGHKPLKGGTP